jgi:voltage-gated potassium channel
VQDLGDALWWAVVTVTTVGYGDITPKTAMGRLVAFGVMLVGISFVSILTANIAAFFVEARQEGVEAAVHDQMVAMEHRQEEILALLRAQNTLLAKLASQGRSDVPPRPHPEQGNLT